MDVENFISKRHDYRKLERRIREDSEELARVVQYLQTECQHELARQEEVNTSLGPRKVRTCLLCLLAEVRNCHKFDKLSGSVLIDRSISLESLRKELKSGVLKDSGGITAALDKYFADCAV